MSVKHTESRYVRESGTYRGDGKGKGRKGKVSGVSGKAQCNVRGSTVNLEHGGSQGLEEGYTRRVVWLKPDTDKDERRAFRRRCRDEGSTDASRLAEKYRRQAYIDRGETPPNPETYGVQCQEVQAYAGKEGDVTLAFLLCGRTAYVRALCELPCVAYWHDPVNVRVPVSGMGSAPATAMQRGAYKAMRREACARASEWSAADERIRDCAERERLDAFEASSAFVGPPRPRPLTPTSHFDPTIARLAEQAFLAAERKEDPVIADSVKAKNERRKERERQAKEDKVATRDVSARERLAKRRELLEQQAKAMRDRTREKLGDTLPTVEGWKEGEEKPAFLDSKPVIPSIAPATATPYVGGTIPNGNDHIVRPTVICPDVLPDEWEQWNRWQQS